jgi:hypothetical protein
MNLRCEPRNWIAHCTGIKPFGRG